MVRWFTGLLVDWLTAFPANQPTTKPPNYLALPAIKLRMGIYSIIPAGAS